MPKSHSPGSYSTRRRWTVAEARAALSALAASGLSPRAFAAREGLKVERLDRWRRRLGTRGKVARVAPAFVEVRRATVEMVEVVLRSGRVLRVAESIDVSVLQKLVEALEETPGC